MIVVDTNLIGYLFLESEHSTLAEQVLLKDAEWAAPLLWRSEFRSVLALYLRKGWLSLEYCIAAMGEALNLMTDLEYDVDSQRVLRLVTLSACSAYDCEFVALAQELGVPLVTADRQILNHFPAVAMPPNVFLGRQ